MTDQTFADVTSRIVWDSDAGHVKHLWRRVNGSTELYPGRVATETGETYPDVSGCDADSSDIPLGVVDLKPGHDIDTAYDDNEWIPIIPVGSGIGVYVLRIGTACGVAVASGDHVGGASEQGKVMKISTSVELYAVGTVAYPEAADTSNDTVIKIWLSK
jgi:hypothetical protein